MKKISVIVTATLLTLPVMAMGADQEVQQKQDAEPAVSVAKLAEASPIQEEQSSPALPPVTDAPIVANSAKAIDAEVSAVKIEDIFSIEMNRLQDRVDQLEQKSEQLSRQVAGLQYTVYGLAGLIVILALLSLSRRKTSNRHNNAEHSDTSKTIKLEDGPEGEYNFMSSKESIPAKLDLARAYIAMEDFVAARETLAEILGEGTEEYRKEARVLLNKIN